MVRMVREDAQLRFARFVIDHKPPACTGWTGGKDQSGYTMFWYEGRTIHGHRVVWEWANGPIPEGLVIRHTCDNPECVRLAHLRLGTMKANMQDALFRNRMPGTRKIPFDAVEQINDLRASGMLVKDIAKLFGVSKQTLLPYFRLELRRKGRYAKGPDHWNYSRGDTPKPRTNPDQKTGRWDPSHDPDA